LCGLGGERPSEWYLRLLSDIGGFGYMAGITFRQAIARLGHSDELKKWWLIADRERVKRKITPAEAMYCVYTARQMEPGLAVAEAAKDFLFNDGIIDAADETRNQEWMIPVFGRKAMELERMPKIVAFRSWIVEHENLAEEVLESVWNEKKAEQVLMEIVEHGRRTLNDNMMTGRGSKTASDALLNAVRELNRIHRIGEKDSNDTKDEILRVVFMGANELE
jgi:hypothetical protein